jgi:hypothetical protein
MIGLQWAELRIDQNKALNTVYMGSLDASTFPHKVSMLITLLAHTASRVGGCRALICPSL